MHDNGKKNYFPGLAKRLKDLMFAPQAAPLPQPPRHGAPKYEEEHKRYEQLLAHRTNFHEETSKTIRRVFYTLSGICLFCVITLAGSTDSQLLTPTATVKLPVLNYEIGFQAFLWVGPLVLVTLSIYLHIFVAEHRRLVIPSESRHPTLPNFGSWTARLVVLLVFYWMVPITLAVFTWKAWPRYGQILIFVTCLITAGAVLLQIRRCPRESRAWAPVALIIAFAIFCAQVYSVAVFRQLNLFKVDLSGEDLRSTNLSRAFLAEANLSSAKLLGADLKSADLSAANLSRADLREANMTEADLSDVHFIESNLEEANLSNANLNGADLSGANLAGASLIGADLSSADLSRANVNQAQLAVACGDQGTNLPEGLHTTPCQNHRESKKRQSIKWRLPSVP